MLGKLFKHEMKATAGLLLPLYLVLAVLTVADRIVIYLDIFQGVLKVIPALITFAYGLSIMAVILITSIYLIVRFYKNLMTDEGYLMFTLPVKSHDLINAKLLVCILWTIISVLVVITSLLFVISGSSVFLELPSLGQALLTQLKHTFGNNTVLLVIEAILFTLLCIMSGTLLIYASIAIGQLFHGHKILGSFAAYIVLTITVQILSVLAAFITLFIIKNISFNIFALPQIILPLIILFLLILSVVYYLITNYILKRKLNLD